MPDSLWPHGLQPTRLLCPWDFPGKDTGMGCHFLLQGIFPTRDETQISHIVGRFFIIWVTKEAGEFQKNIYFCFIDYAKVFDWVDHNKLWKILKEMEISEHLNCLLRNLYAGQEATVRTGHGTMDWFKIEKGIHQGCILLPCLFNYIQSTSWEMLGWRNNKLESRLPGEISTFSDMQIIPL